ncbi:beta-N-acetylhexosaminidase [Zunongwangia sp.]|uniref:beta-N-acetylhexosaminidase n=1 Tax=Zunongwangia sp. TaxID=1965325 RepID=UPI003AA8BF22
MKNYFFLFLFLSFLACKKDYDNPRINQLSRIDNKAETYSIIPKPVQLDKYKGRFLVNDSTQIYAYDSLQNEAKLAKEYLGGLPKITAIPENPEALKYGIILKINDSLQHEDAYHLSIQTNNIKIEGKSAEAVFYGIQSLRQLVPLKKNRAKKAEIVNKELALTTNKFSEAEILIPAVEISDYPRFSYRGMHLDVARHMFPVSFIKRYIDMIALHKMNTFHWHLTDDQGWRIEIKKYPKLTEVGAKRKETIVGKNFDPYKGDEKEYGGFYTQEQIKEIVAYAKTKHVTIIPEIELPGHSRAALAAYPELGNRTGPYTVATKWGVFEQIYAPKEATFTFLENVLSEVAELFPGKYIHIGGDEVPKKEWKESKQAQQFMKEHNLKDANALQSYFVQRIEKFLNGRGKQIIGWDEILEGGIAPNATIMSWRGTKGGIEAAKQKHDVIMTPNQVLYFDHYQGNPNTEPLAIGGHTSVFDVYNYNPIPESLNQEESNYILGAQANVWTEYIDSPEKVEYMVLPRMSALAEVVWTPKNKKDWFNFLKRLPSLEARFDNLSLNYSKNLPTDIDLKKAEELQKNPKS